MGIYVVVARSRASAIFYPVDRFTTRYVPQEGEPFRLIFRTNFEEEGFEAPLPKNLWVEAHGPANNLHHAAELFVNAALEISSIIALTANASTGLLEPELIFDATPEAEEHEFLQSFVPDPPVSVVPGRRIDLEVLSATVGALATHLERQRLQRATAQYVEALRFWRPGHEISCLAHLYMGVEAVTKAVLREYLRKTDQSEDDVVLEWGVDATSRLKRRKGIDTEARRRLIFRGDANCFKSARDVSDGFEHGFSDFGVMRKPAREVIVKTAAYLRRAIMETIGIEQSLMERALGSDYKEPRGPLILVRYLRGTLVGNLEQLAAKDQHYPIMEWRTKLSKVLIGDHGKYSFAPEDTFTAKLGKGAQFRPSRYEVWDGSTIKEMPKEMMEAAMTKDKEKL